MQLSRRTPVGVLKRTTILGAGLLQAAVVLAQELPPDITEPSFGAVLERQELQRAVLERNPGIAAARQALEAARQRVPQAESLPDPMASYSLAPLTLGGEVEFGNQLTLSQRLPYPGRRQLRGEMAGTEAAVLAQGVDEVRLELATMALLLFDAYSLVHRALEINAEHQELLDGFQRIATSRYSMGLASQQAPLQAEVEGAHLLHQDVVLSSRARTLTVRINALLHRDPDALLPPPARLPEPGEPAHSHPGAAPELVELEATALGSRPELLAQAARIDARETAVRLAELERLPDFEVMTTYSTMWAMPRHRWMVGVGVNVPVWRKRIQAGVAEAEAELAAARSEQERKVDEVREQVAVARVELHEARHVIELYRDRVLPAARDQVQAARTGFETGATSMLALIDAARSLRTSELQYEEAIAALWSRRAELERSLGRLPAGLGQESPEPTTPPENQP